MDCEAFAYELLEKKHVAVVPGKAYGDAYDNYIRIAFTLQDKLLIKAMDRMKDFCSEIENNKNVQV